MLRSLGACAMALLGLLATPVTATGAPKTYQIQPGQSRVDIQVFKDGVADGFAHNHVIRGTDVTGTVTYDPDDVAQCSFDATLKTTTLKADLASARKRYKLEGTLDKDDREEVEENMKAEDQLHVSKYPTVRMKSVKVSKAGERYLIIADTTLKGETRRTVLRGQVSVNGDTLTGTGKMKVKQSAFGMEPYSAFLGAVENKDELIIHVRFVAEALQAAPEAPSTQATPSPEPQP
ncbi:MAG: YceI family protein [Bradymonadia bacterium]